MPHLTIEYSENISQTGNIQTLCTRLANVLLTSNLFEIGAVRVRARPCAQYFIADQHLENGFADMVLRLGSGRQDSEKSALGASLMAAGTQHFADLLAKPHFALSLEIQDISAKFSWKTNAMHPRLRTP